MQTGFLGPLATVAGLNVAGIGDGEQGYVPNSTPPNPSVAVGTTQVVQVAGDAMAVFDKASGAIVAGFPKTGNLLWSGFGGACESAADGMVTVRFDRAASRWVVLLTAGTPVVQCLAVSTTADATGAYARYAFFQGGSVLADGSKLGIWPDGYYVAANRFDSEQAFAGARVCALDRAAMLNGAAATQQCFQLPAASGGGLMPADLDGALAPPAGAPNPLVGLASNALQFWKFHVDWAQPANSTLSGPVSLPVAAFTPACDGGHCILQPRTSQKLDARSDRLMARAAYRVFADGHDALVVTHAVKTGRRPRLAGSGQRWYEVRNLLQTPSVFQQGTFSPDRKFRWMGSIAMDRMGNIALGYSVASSTLFPGLRYSGRLAGDAPGQMQNEAVLQAVPVRSCRAASTGASRARWCWTRPAIAASGPPTPT